MYIKKKYFILLAFIISSVSCKKDFLNQVPDDKLTIGEVFQKRNLSDQYLANIYRHINNLTNLYVAGNPWEGLSDEEDITYNRPGQPNYATYQMNFGSWSATSDYYQYWGECYRGIRSASYFMQNIAKNIQILEKSNGKDLIKRYVAEARFCRAFFYSCLLRQYGPIVLLPDKPIPPDIKSNSPLLNLPRSPYDSCVTYIVNQLDLAAKDLPLNFTDQSTLNYGRATKAACMALKSRVLLYAASPLWNGNKSYANFRNSDGTSLVSQQYDAHKWEIAADAAKDIIDLGIFSLFREYDSEGNFNPFLSCRDVLLIPWNSEWIFASTMPKGAGDIFKAPRRAAGFPGVGVTQQLVDAFEMANGQQPILGYQADGLPIINPNSDYSETGFSIFQAPDDPHSRKTFNMWVNREPRFYVAVTYAGRPWINTSTNIGIITYEPWLNGSSGKNAGWDYSRTGYNVRKDVSPNSAPNEGRYDYRPNLIFRYGEVLLDYVESLNEYDPGNPDVLKYLNKIRERAGVPQYGAGINPLPVPENQEVMREAIHHERRIELCFENIRYFDTRRWKIANKTAGGLFYGMNTNADPPKFYSRTVFETRVFHKGYYLFPIPQSEIDRDKNLVQNPGW